MVSRRDGPPRIGPRVRARRPPCGSLSISQSPNQFLKGDRDETSSRNRVVLDWTHRFAIFVRGRQPGWSSPGGVDHALRRQEFVVVQYHRRCKLAVDGRRRSGEQGYPFSGGKSLIVVF